MAFDFAVICGQKDNEKKETVARSEESTLRSLRGHPLLVP